MRGPSMMELMRVRASPHQQVCKTSVYSHDQHSIGNLKGAYSSHDNVRFSGNIHVKLNSYHCQVRDLMVQ